MLKADAVRMRLVTDYIKLNKHVHRPIHPFPSTRNILQFNPHGHNFFAKLDAVHGYFQLAMDRVVFPDYVLIASGTVQVSLSSDGFKCIVDRVALTL